VSHLGWLAASHTVQAWACRRRVALCLARASGLRAVVRPSRAALARRSVASPIAQSAQCARPRRIVFPHPRQIFSRREVSTSGGNGEHYHRQTIREREAPGPFFFPPTASLITSGGRLLLALAQKCVEDAGGKILFCDTDSLCIVSNEKGGFSYGGAHADLGYVQSADMSEFAPVPCLQRDTVLKISERFASLNPYSFGGTILKVEDVNHVDGDPRKGFRDLYGYAISAKRYCLFEGKHIRKIVDAKAHGIGYLMDPIKRKRNKDNDEDEDQFAVEFWQKVLQNKGISFKSGEPDWLGRPAMIWTRGMLQRMHVVTGKHRYCGKEFKRKLEQGPVDHEVEFRCKVYENGRVVAGPETLRQSASFSERQISKRTGVHRDTIRLIRHGKGVKRSTYEKVVNFLKENAPSVAEV
jgi:hypothetical protein